MSAVKFKYATQTICPEDKHTPRFYWFCTLPVGHDGGCYMVRDKYIDKAVR